MSEKPDLLACPFCGEAPIYWAPAITVHCGSCNASLPKVHKSEAIAAWNRRAGGEGWQSIETAPRDGSKFDVWMGRDGYRICDVYWADIQEWWSTDGAYGPEEPTPLAAYPQPTHWRPLPAAPGDAP